MNGETSGLTAAIAQFVAAARLEDAPQSAIEKSKKVLADTFATMLAGAGSEVAAPLLRYVDDAGATGSRAILATNRRTSPELAALANGTFGHALDFDDVLPIMPGHPSAVILAAALASSAKLSGRDLIEAHVAGIEVGGKLGMAITHGHYERGFHGTGTLGIFAGVAALAKLHRLEVDAIGTVLGIASSMASGVRRNFGTMVKPLHTGWAARNAVVALGLARCGLTAAPDALEGRHGFFASYGVDESNPDAVAGKLGSPWVLVDPGIGLKQYPCYNGLQRPMHGVLELRSRLGLDAATLERVECRMAPGATRVMIYPRPKTGLEGKFSLHYALAAGVLDGRYALATFTDEAVNRPQIRALLEKIHLSEEERCGGGDPLLHTRAAGTRGFVELEARTTGGRRAVVRIDTVPGHPTKPLGWDAIEAKFVDCAIYGGIEADRAKRAFERVVSLESCANVAGIVDLLTSSGVRYQRAL